MKVKVVLAVLLCSASLTIAGEVGTTSSWGIVISPCAWCETVDNIEVHHIWPQHIAPERRYDTNNMVCLCRKKGTGCHFYIGHHGIAWNFVFTNVMTVINIGKSNGWNNTSKH